MDKENLNNIYQQNNNCVAKEVDDEIVIVPVQDNLAEMDYLYTLNETAAFIWEHLDGQRTLDEIAHIMTNSFDVEYDTAAKDVLKTITEIEEFVILSHEK